MARFKRNVAANLSGRVCTAILGIVFVPVIIRLMGIEAYGLVAFFATLQAMFSILDLGLSATINRELARLSARSEPPAQVRDLVRTLEVCYWAFALVIAGCMLSIAPFVTAGVHPAQLSAAELQQAAAVMGVVMALQWPLSFYEGGLMGLQRQVVWNVVSVSMTALRQVGVVLLLWLVSPSVQTFLMWTAVTSGLQTGITAWLVWHHLPRAERAPRFRPELVARVWRFAAGLTGTAIVSLGLTQLDKVILSRFLPLDQFGYYALATVAAGSLHYLIGPIYSAAFPRFSELAASAGQQDTLRLHYHRIAQFSSVLVLSAAAVLIAFAPEVLLLWTRDPATVAETRTLMAILVVGTALNSLIHIPYALQLAHGWPTLQLSINTIALLVLAPLMVFVARQAGAVGVASMWVALNLTYVAVTVPLMHRRLLRGDLWQWYRKDVGLPLAAAVVSIVLWRWFVPPSGAPVVLALWLTLVSASTLLFTALVVPDTRAALLAARSRWIPLSPAWSRGRAS